MSVVRLSQPALGVIATATATLLVLLSTVFRGSNRYVPLTVVEWLSLALIAVVCASMLGRIWRPRLKTDALTIGFLTVLSTAPLWLACLQNALLPLAAHTQIWASALAALPAVALFLTALTCSDQQLQMLMRAWLIVAGLGLAMLARTLF